MALELILGGVAATLGTGGLFTLARYKIGQPHQFLVRTGWGIKTVKVSKQGMQWPFQTAMFLDVTPKNYSFGLSAMSKEKLQFYLPGVMTIGPRLDYDSLQSYAQLLSNADVESLVHGIIEGETRVLAAGLSMNDLFQNRTTFKETIIKGVNDELEPFGLTVRNANIQELQDSDGSEYFKYLRQKAREGANNEAKVDVAEAQMKGNIGTKERESLQRQAQAKLETSAREAELQNEQMVEKAKMELEQNKIQYALENQMSRVEAEQSIKLRQVKLTTQVEENRYQEQLKQGIAQSVVSAEVEASRLCAEAHGKAEAQKCIANAELHVAQKVAEGNEIMWRAQARGINQVVLSLGGSPSAFLWYQMMEKGTLQQLASANAEAVQNLNPKITIWNTGSSSSSSSPSSNPFESLQNLFQFLPPVLTTIAQQTGLNVPFVPTTNPSPPSPPPASEQKESGKEATSVFGIL